MVLQEEKKRPNRERETESKHTTNLKKLGMFFKMRPRSPLKDSSTLPTLFAPVYLNDL